MENLPGPTVEIDTHEHGIVYLEDITDDKMLVLRRKPRFALRPNSVGLLTQIPHEYIYLHYPNNLNIFKDKDINCAINYYFQEILHL